MNLINQTVIHKAFGEGTITTVENGYITILFSQGEKKFMYPYGFKHFLMIKDAACAAYVQAEISAFDAKEAEAAEQERLQSIRQQEALASSAAKDRKPAKKVKAPLNP